MSSSVERVTEREGAPPHAGEKPHSVVVRLDSTTKSEQNSTLDTLRGSLGGKQVPVA